MTDAPKPEAETNKQRRRRRVKAAFDWLRDLGKAIAKVVRRRRG